MEKFNKKALKIIILLLLIPIIVSIILSFTNLKDKNTYSSSTNFNSNEITELEYSNSNLKIDKESYATLYVSAVGLVFMGVAIYIYLYKKKEW